jgi:hypothetical protein
MKWAEIVVDSWRSRRRWQSAEQFPSSYSGYGGDGGRRERVSRRQHFGPPPRVVDMKGDGCIEINADMTVTIGQTYEIVDNNTCQCASCLGDVIPRISVFESCGFD